MEELAQDLTEKLNRARNAEPIPPARQAEKKAFFLVISTPYNAGSVIPSTAEILDDRTRGLSAFLHL